MIKQSQTGFATLDAGLLARKGEALPALSQETKILADVGLFSGQEGLAAPLSPPQGTQDDGKTNSATASSDQPEASSKASSKALPTKPRVRLKHASRQPAARLKPARPPVNPTHDQRPPAEARAQPNADCATKTNHTVVALSATKSTHHQSVPPASSPYTPEQERITQTARVTFRMPMEDFLRLKMAGAILERPCRDLILDALNCHLDSENIASFRHCSCLKR